MTLIRNVRSAAVLALSMALPVFAADAPAPQAGTAKELPVTKAVLFSSGVGYFEHDGTVDGNADVSLKFTTDQINDVLKSLLVSDEKSAGASVTYASNEPLIRALRSFGIDISDSPTLSQLLGRLRGAKVIVKAPDAIEGVILSVESRTRVVGTPPASVTDYVLSIVTDGAIRSIPMDRVESIKLADDKLQDELNKALTLVAASRDRDRKVVSVHLAGNGQRQVSLAYLVQTPVWKTSYRLDLGKPLIQGWAIVENTTDTDWTNVKLSLVSGRPISFVQDLFTPLYLDRPVVQPELFASLRPRLYEEGMEEQAAGRVMALRSLATDEFAAGEGVNGLRRKDMANKALAPMASTPPGRVGFGSKGGADADVNSFYLSEGAAAARGGNIGELFQFTVDQLVNLPRRQSSMLPIVNQKISVQKVSIYNQSVEATHPLNGVWLTNDTGNKLPAGPITVLDGGTYAGDAQIDYLSAGDKRLLSYAVDLAVTVNLPRHPGDDDVSIVSAKIVHGVLYLNHKENFSQTYTIKNKATEKRTMVIEHPIINGRVLVEPAKADEQTPTVYRFVVPIEAGKTGDFVVKEQMLYPRSFAIVSQNSDYLLTFTTNGQVSKPVQDALAKAVALRNELARIEGDLASVTGRSNVIKNGQDRIRADINTVGRDSPEGQRYVKKLKTQEDEIEALDVKIADLEKARDAKRAELEDYLNKLDVE